MRFRAALRLLGAIAVVSTPTVGEARGAARETATPWSWCAPGIESLPGDVCYLDGGQRPTRRTLVIFLHGAVAKNTTWQWNHQRGLLRLVKSSGVEVLFPQSPLSDVGYVWPGAVSSQESVEQPIIDGWMSAKHALEQRDGRPFDEVFVMGFSSGAYFVSSLAMRGRLDVDGYAVFAGGQPMGASRAPVQRRSPVFVGVCAEDRTSAAHSRAFAAALLAAGIPRFVNEQPVGHGLSHLHFHHALSYLRHAGKPRP